MAMRRYHDFVLLTDDPEIGDDGKLAAFSVRVFQSPAGEGERKERVTIPDYEGLNAQRRRLADRRLDLPEQMAYGRALAALLLPPYARGLFRRSLSALGHSEGLRIRLRLLQRLAHLPWEYMHLQEEGRDPVASDFCALDPRISIVRHEAIAVPPERIPPGDVRRVLITMATPRPHDRYHPLQTLPVEQQQIRAALSKIPGLDVLYLPDYGDAAEWATIPGARLDQVQASVQALQHVDLFHFSGHGDFATEMGPLFGETEGMGYIILADEDNRAVQVAGDRLVELLREHGIRLVTLGACETGERDIFHAWSSVAAALLKGRIPSVVAMQFTVRDELAAAFMASVYQGLVAGSTIDEAVFSGRAAVRALCYGDLAEARDWGTPVLYSRVPGGCLFPPVENEKAREEAQQALDVRSSLHQAWWNWTELGETVGVRQLRYLAELSKSREGAGTALEVQPAQALLLLRSAVVEKEPVECWLAHLRETGAGLIAELDDAGSAAASAIREEASLFDLQGAPRKGRPPQAGLVAWTAARHSVAATRHTAALALTALPPVPGAGLERIEGALRGVKLPWKRFARRVELRGALADGDPVIEQANAGLPPWDRLGIWLWRFWQRAFDDRDRILASTLGTAIGAALALGLFRVLVAIPTHQSLGIFFSSYSYIALILGGALGLALALAPPAMLIHRDSQSGAAPLGLAMGALFFAIAHFLVMLLFTVHPAEVIYRAGTGALAGLGLALALYGLGRRPWPKVSWFLRAGTASVALTLAQFLAMVAAEGWQDRKFRASVEFSTNPKLYDNTLGYSDLYRSLDGWLQSLGDFHGGDLLALVDAALVGIVLVLGMGLGLWVAVKLLDRYRVLAGRVEAE